MGPRHSRAATGSSNGRQMRKWSGFGNVAIACLLVCADIALPIRSVWLDVPVAGITLALWISGFGILFNQPWAVTLLRAAAKALLCFGLLASAVLALTSSFLFGVHGHFLRDGVELVVVGFALVVPYTLAYPMLLLASVKPTGSSLRT